MRAALALMLAACGRTTQIELSLDAPAGLQVSAVSLWAKIESTGEELSKPVRCPGASPVPLPQRLVVVLPDVSSIVELRIDIADSLGVLHEVSTRATAVAGTAVSAAVDFTDGQVATCRNGTRDAAESDVDCGGPCAPCTIAKACSADADCETRTCDAARCTLASGPPHWLSAAPTRGDCDGATAALAGDGHIYLVWAGAGTAVDVYDPAADGWSSGPARTVARDNAALVAAHDGSLYLLGGDDSPTVEALSPGGAWRALAQGLSQARSSVGAAADAKHLYAVCGTLGPALSDRLQIFDGQGWRLSSGTLPQERTGVGAAVGADGRLYAVGGVDKGGTMLAAADAWSPATDGWAAPAPAHLNVAREGIAVAAAPDGRIWAVSGQDRDTPGYDTVEAYGPLPLDAWKTLPALGEARRGAAASLGPDGRLYVMGGDRGGNPVRSVEVYGPRISLSVSSGAKRTRVTVAGTNFAAGASVRVLFGCGVGPVALGSSDAAGELTAPLSFVVPDVESGSYDVTVVDDRSRYAIRVPFTVR